MTSAKYAHFTLNSSNILTIASEKHDMSQGILIRFGFTICNTKDDKYDRKFGNQIAYQRMIDNPYGFYIEEKYVSVTYNLISLRLIQVIRSLVESSNRKDIGVFGCYKQLNSHILITDLRILESLVKQQLQNNITDSLNKNVYRFV